MSMEDFSTHINLAEGLGRLGGNKKIFARLLDKFENDKNFDEMVAAAEAGDIAKAAAAAHAVKGMAANLSMPALYETSTAYEHELKAGNHAPELFDAMKDAMDKTIASLAAAKQELQ